MPRLRSYIRRARRGQAAVLIALVLFSLVVFLALATNMGILVNDKIRMQSAADLGAYAAAYKEAQVLNTLAAKNREIQEKVKWCRDQLTSIAWESRCDCQARSDFAETFIDICQVEIDRLATEFVLTASWGNSVQPALLAGMETMDANVPGLRSSGSFMYQGDGASSQSGVYSVEGTMFMPDRPAIAEFKRVRDSKFNYPVLLVCQTNVGCMATGIVPSARTHELSTWYYKETANADVWAMAEASGTMRSAYLDIAYSSGGSDGGYFGASSTGGSDRMYAVAVAKPFGGSVGPTRASPAQRSGNTALNGPYYSGRGTEYARMTMIAQYRARLAGVGEWDRVSATTKPRTALSLSLWGADASRFRH
ncbi:MAG: hypothetical protein H6741_26215 [Alphaproteobacteria bacterium]|nr:hypothetical protein [Alphaproteobacteria bacterium]